MKKFFLSAVFLLAATLGVIGFSACEESGHVHDWGEWTSDGKGGHTRVCKLDETHVETGECKDHLVYYSGTASCEQAGETIYGCTACGYTYKEETEALEHKWGAWNFDTDRHQHFRICENDPGHIDYQNCTFETEVVAPTCEEDGYTLHTCTTCAGSYRDQPVSKLNHDWDDWHIVEGTETHVRYCKNNPSHKQDGVCEFSLEETVQGSCTEDGYDLYVCGTCHGEVRRNEKIAAGHSWSGWTFDPETKAHYQTCLADGCDERQDGTCRFEMTETKPTCETNGFTSYFCPICRGSYTTYDEATQKATGHDYPDAWTPAENGSHYRDCKNAPGDLSHRQTDSCDYDIVEADCRNPVTTYTCKTCRYSYTVDGGAATGHRYGNWSKVEGQTYHHRLCEVCGDEQKENCVYTPQTTNATCTAAGKTEYICNTCRDIDAAQTVSIPQLDHLFPTEWTHVQGTTGSSSRHYRECEYGCGERTEEPCTMQPIADVPTCSNPDGVHTLCEHCHYTEGETDGIEHQWGSWQHIEVRENGQLVHYHIRYCERETCHEKKGDVRYSEQAPCSFDRTTTNSTCLTAGKTTYRCQTCQHSYEETTGRALGHDYGDWVCNVGKNTHTKTCRRDNCDGTPENPKSVTESCNYQPGTVVKPTCLTNGYTVYTCSGCRNTEQRNIQTKLGHDFEDQPWIQGKNGTHYRVCKHDARHLDTHDCDFNRVVTDPTCLAQGYTTETCNTCSYSRKVDYRSALGHNWVLDDKQAYSLDDHTHPVKCTRCATTDIQRCSYNTRIEDATCLKPAHHIHTCTVCMHVYEHDEGEALGHRWGPYTYQSATRTHNRSCTRYGCDVKEGEQACTGVFVSEHEADCQTFGWKNYRCRDCGGEYIDDMTQEKGDHKWSLGWASSVNSETHYKTCTVCRASDSKPCLMEDLQRVDATCTKDGYAIRVCKTCARFTRVIFGKLEHNFGDDINPWKSDGNGNHTRTCTRANCGFSETVRCTMVSVAQAATCDAEGRTGTVCNVCNYSVGLADLPRLSHEMSPIQSSNDGNHFQYCLRMCGYKLTSPCNLVGTEQEKATCTAPAGIQKQCEQCGYRYEQITTPALGHHWVLDECNETTHLAHCDREDCSETASGNHDFTESNVCPYCQYDGLTYEYGDEQHTYYVVRDDSKVPNAKRIIVPASYDGKPVKGIRQFAIQNNNVVEHIVLPQSIEEIGMYAFSHCEKLLSVEFTGGEEAKLKTIERNAFSHCYELYSINLPDSVRFLDREVFYLCRSLKTIELPEEITIENDAFTDSGIYNDPENWTEKQVAFYLRKHLLRVSTSFEGTFTIAADTVTVGAGAFRDCIGLTGVSIPESVKTFDADAFKGCTALTTVTYAGDTHKWLAIVFENDFSSPLHYATDLKISGAHGKIDFIPPTVTSIPAGTFRGTEITSVDIPSGVVSIGAGAFENCADLKDIKIPDTVVYIGYNAFKGTAFYDNPENWENGLLYIDHHLVAAKDEEIKNGAIVIRPETVTISPGVFYQFKNIESVRIPESVKWIGEGAFVQSSLKTAEFEGEDPTFFSSNVGGAGRWLSGDHLKGATAAWYLTQSYPNEWKRVYS